MRKTGLLALPRDGAVSWTARADPAVAAVAALKDTSLFDGITPPLTASEVVTFSEIASLASEILEHEISRVVVSALCDSLRATSIRPSRQYLDIKGA